MGKETSIAWCDHTFNPWWGCVKVSPACTNCYAATFDKRVGGDHWGPKSERRFFGDKHWSEPLKWNAAAEKASKRARVFCASMADVFELNSDVNDARRRLFDLIAITPMLDWLLLTKRPESIATMIPWASYATPWPNVWLGTTVENQEYADSRIPHLLAVPAVVHFLSCEPLLGPIDLRHVQHDHTFEVDALTGNHGVKRPLAGRGPRVDWVIAGCESGARARACDVAWLRFLRDQCRDAGNSFLLKQAVADVERCDGCGGVVRYRALSSSLADASCKCCGEGPEACDPDGIMEGEGSRTKKIAGVEVIELPYLDGRQYANFPEVA